MPDESSKSGYELLDFGRGWKWERFGNVVVKRPSPAAERVSTAARKLLDADIEFQREGNGLSGQWRGKTPSSDWQTAFEKLVFQLKLSEQGQVGVFPEQHENWRWIRRAAAPLKDLNVLNLFAYTGGSSLAAASAGARVTHIDAARSVVSWARENAELSKLESRPIRWIAEDAVRFVQREIKRKNKYDGLILDPPSFGRGPKGEIWKVDTHLNDLLTSCSKLALPSGFRMVVLSCHSAGFESTALRALLNRCLGIKTEQIEAFPLNLTDKTGRELPSGHCARFVAAD